MPCAPHPHLRLSLSPFVEDQSLRISLLTSQGFGLPRRSRLPGGTGLSEHELPRGSRQHREQRPCADDSSVPHEISVSQTDKKFVESLGRFCGIAGRICGSSLWIRAPKRRLGEDGQYSQKAQG